MWTEILLGLLMLTVGVVGAAFVVVGLPGTWLVLGVGFVIEWLRPGTYSWWTLGVCGGLCLVGEAVELLASGAAAGRAGGGFSSAVWAVIGGIVGAVAGTVLLPLPLIGTIVGSVVGAGLFAAMGHRHSIRAEWGDVARVGRGAAVGRLWAILIKAGFGMVVAVLLVIGAFRR